MLDVSQIESKIKRSESSQTKTTIESNQIKNRESNQVENCDQQK